MKIIYKLSLTFFFLVSILLSRPALAEALPVKAYLFYGDGCPHCTEEKQYLFNILKNKYPSLEINEYEIYNNRANTILLQKVAKTLSVKVDGVPFLVIGDQSYVGYAKGLTNKEIEARVAQCSASQCPDALADIMQTDKKSKDTVAEAGPVEESSSGDERRIVKLPFIGEVNVLNFSLPFLTVVMGALDGFNPCAMWTLLFLIGLLLGIEDRKRMWLIGTAFIVASALVYFMFMVAWLNLILFLGFVTWVKILIGLVAISGGVYSLREFCVNKDSGCKVTGSENKQKTFAKLKAIVQQNSLWLALGGIILLAFIVNLVELICSAGLPAVYTQVLALNNMSGWHYYGYIMLYILFFMLDDLFVFFMAMITLQLTGITTKYTRVSRLVGGFIMLIIGLLLIFKPSWLMFG